jgi:hypothetical protein
MLLGHGAIGQFAVAEALSGLVVNAGTVDVSMGQAATFSIGTETATGTAVFAVTTAGAGTFSLGTEVATGGANVSPTTAGSITASIGEETAFGEAFQNLISLSAGSPNFFLWNEVDDSQTVTWKDVNPGSTD